MNGGVHRGIRATSLFRSLFEMLSIRLTLVLAALQKIGSVTYLRISPNKQAKAVGGRLPEAVSNGRKQEKL